MAFDRALQKKHISLRRKVLNLACTVIMVINATTNEE